MVAKYKNNSLTPIILIGAGRSGTKFFRNIISQNEETAAIPYDINYIWRYGNEDYKNDIISPDDITKDIKDYINKNLLKLSNYKANKQNFLVEKTVSNTLRVPFVEEVLDHQAKFIHIIRDGRAVTESAYRMWNQPSDFKYLIKKLKYFPITNYKYAFWFLKEKLRSIFDSSYVNVWGPRYQGIEKDLEKYSVLEVCAKQWQNCVEYANEDLLKIPEDRKLTIRYEDLISDSKTLDKVCDFIGINDRDSIFDFYNKNLKVTNNEKWKTNLSKVEINKVNNIIENTLKKLNYID
ncbi:MAG: sulfotransferase family protein [Bacillota bacterium]